MSKATRGGTWVFRHADIHRCDFPVYDNTVKTSDIWQCAKCKQKWICCVNSDYRDPTPWLTWKEHNE